MFAWPSAQTAVMGPQQLAGVLSIVAQASAETRGLPFDEEEDARMREAVEDQIEREQTALANSGRGYDDGDHRSARHAHGSRARAFSYPQRAGGGSERVRRLPAVMWETHLPLEAPWSCDRSSPTTSSSSPSSSCACPERDRTFFNEDVLDPAVVEGFLRPREGDLRLILHDDDGSVVGWLALFGGVGWSHHVARIGLVVDPDARGRGLGKQLAREGLLRGLQAGYSKLVVEIIAEERPAIAMFQAIGFQIEALLLDHVRDLAGNVHDLVVLTHHAEQARSELDADRARERAGLTQSKLACTSSNRSSVERAGQLNWVEAASATTTAPLSMRAAGEHMNSTIAAMSSGSA